MINGKVYIITEGSKDLGFGHIARCVSFYDKFEDLKYSVEMLIDGDISCSKLLENRRHKYVSWHRNIADLDYTKGCILFVDSLIASQKEVDYLQSLSPYFAIIDDFQRRLYKRALIIDWTPNVENTTKHAHNKNGINKLLQGLEYSVLRNPFINTAYYEFRKLHSITIIMGGSDIRNLTIPIALMIRRAFPNLKVNVVLGPGTQEIQNQECELSLYRSLNAEEIKSLFLNSDIIISAGGQTLFELAALNVPTIPIQVIDNQTEDLTGLKALGFFDEIFQWNDPLLLEKIQDKIVSLSDVQARKEYVQSFRVKEVGKGLDKIISCLRVFCNESI